jgi:hypothetical protein
VEYQRAVEIDPLSPILQSQLALGQFEVGQQDLALQTLREQSALNPGFPRHRAFNT